MNRSTFLSPLTGVTAACALQCFGFLDKIKTPKLSGWDCEIKDQWEDRDPNHYQGAIARLIRGKPLTSEELNQYLYSLRGKEFKSGQIIL